MTAPSPNRGLIIRVSTDSVGRIVFADAMFRTYFKVDHDGQLVGKSLTETAGIQRDALQRLMDDITEAHYVENYPLLLAGKHVGERMSCTGKAIFDERGGFLGTDLTLSDQFDANSLPQFAGRWDALKNRVAQPADTTPETSIRDRDNAHRDSYCLAVLESVQVLVARMGGPRLRQALDRALNTVAFENEIPAALHGGEITVESSLTSHQWRLLLDETIAYASDIIGQRVVLHEVKQCAEQFDEYHQAVAWREGLPPYEAH